MSTDPTAAQRFHYREGFREPMLDDEAYAQAVAGIEGDNATQLDVTLQAHYPNITPEGIDGLAGEEWEKVCAAAKLPPSAKVRERVRARVVGWRRRNAERAATETVEDLFATFTGGAS